MIEYRVEATRNFRGLLRSVNQTKQQLSCLVSIVLATTVVYVSILAIGAFTPKIMNVYSILTLVLLWYVILIINHLKYLDFLGFLNEDEIDQEFGEDLGQILEDEDGKRTIIRITNLIKVILKDDRDISSIYARRQCYDEIREEIRTAPEFLKEKKYFSLLENIL